MREQLEFQHQHTDTSKGETLFHILKDVHFPVFKHDLIEQYGNQTIHLDSHHMIQLRDALSLTSQERFYSVRDLSSAIQLVTGYTHDPLAEGLYYP